MRPPDAIPRSVKPRKSRFTWLPIVTIVDEEVCSELGILVPLEEYIKDTLPTNPSLLVCRDSAKTLARVQSIWSTIGFRASKQEKAIYLPELETEQNPDGRVTFAREIVIPHYVGWSQNKFRTVRRSLLSYFLDPIVFYSNSKTLVDIFGSDFNDINHRTLLHWGRLYRIFCQENDFLYKQTTGALSAQFLTDKRFYPEPRRKVPKATNDRLRTKLPGNHIRLTVTPGRARYNGYYLDQRRAHHYHALHTRLPNANSLFAYGDFSRLKTICFDGGEFLDGEFAGYVAGEFEGSAKGTAYLPPRFRRRRINRRFVSTAEWPFLSDAGIRCNGLYAAWGSRERDTGIPQYSRFAESELDRWSESGESEWLKPILVATYGVLAVNAQKLVEVMYGGRDVPVESRDMAQTSWFAGDMELHGFLVRNTRSTRVEPGITNVLHRILLESATRTESLGYANFLVSHGQRVLMVHADGLICEDLEGTFPSRYLIDPWRIKSYLTGLEFEDEQSFTSMEMTRLPGRALRGRAARIDRDVIVPKEGEYDYDYATTA